MGASATPALFGAKKSQPEGWRFHRCPKLLGFRLATAEAWALAVTGGWATALARRRVGQADAWTLGAWLGRTLGGVARAIRYRRTTGRLLTTRGVAARAITTGGIAAGTITTGCFATRGIATGTITTGCFTTTATGRLTTTATGRIVAGAITGRRLATTG
jgi:hypothetical protein